MEIDGLHLSFPSAYMGKQSSQDQGFAALNDMVTLGGSAPYTPIDPSQLATRIFESRKIVWSNSWKGGDGIGKGIMMTPDGDILTGTYCDLKKVNCQDGATVWEKDISKPIRNLSTSPAVIAKDGTLLIGTTDGTLYSLDPSTGKEKWTYKTGSYSTTPLQAPDGTIYVQKNKDMAAVNPDGTEKFQTPIGRDRLEMGYVDNYGAVFVRSDDDMYAINPDGTVRWQAPGREISGFPDDPDRIYTTVSKPLPHPQHKGSTIFHTLVTARDSKTGDKLWENEYDYAQISRYHKGTLFVYEHDKLSAVDVSTGKPLWESEGDRMRRIAAVLDDGTVIVSGHEKVAALDGKTGKQKWAQDIKNIPSDVETCRTGRGMVLLGGYDHLYGINPADGSIEFKFKLDKGVQRMFPSQDETKIFVEEIGTGTIHAVDFRSNADMAKDIMEQEQSPKEGGEIKVEDDYVIIDGVKIPRHLCVPYFFPF